MEAGIANRFGRAPTWVSAALVALALPFRALAGGFEIADQGPKAAGRAGAFTVLADDVSAMDYNPAGLALIRGTRFFLANRFTFSHEEFRRARTLDWSDAAGGVPRLVTFEAVKNLVPVQPLGPMVGVASDFGLKDWAFAFGVYGPPGTISQAFPLDGPQKYMLVEREVVILYYTLAVAWKHRDDFAVGASLQWVDVPTMKFSLVVDGNSSPRLVNPVSSRFDMESRFAGSDRVGFTTILGLWYRPFPRLEFAFSGRIVPVPIRASGRLAVNPLALNLSKPPVLTRGGNPDDAVTFSFTLPIRLRAGVRWAPLDLFDLELDLGYESWSMVDAFVLDGEGLVAEVLGQKTPIGKIAIQRNWRDTWSVRLGGDLNLWPGRFAARAGMFYESAAVPDAYAYVDVMSFHRLGTAVGFTLAIVKGLDLSAAYTYVFQMPVVVTEEESRIYQQVPGSPCKSPYTDPDACSEHYYGKPSAHANAGTYLSRYHFLSVGLSYRF